MGAFLTAILQGAGRTGSDVAKGRLDAEDRKLKLLQSQMGLSEIRQKMAMNAAPQFAASHVEPGGELINTKRDPLTGALSNEPGGREAPKGTYKSLLTESGDYVLFNDVTGERKPFTDDKGNAIRGYPKGKNGPLIVDGKPIGVIRNGLPLTPDDPDFTPADAVLLASSLKGYTESEKRKDERIRLASSSRVEAYMKTREYGAMDASTGALVFVTPDEMRKSPGRYAPAGPAVTAKNRSAIFDEIDTTKGFLKDAIAQLPNDAFDTVARLQISYALRDEDPRNAWRTFLNSEAAATLSPAQIEYVTALVSMDESAMSLRSVAGMGQGSDMLRGAIYKMLPGAGTPSKAYALRQVQIFEGELNALRRSVPGIGAPGMGGGVTIPSSPSGKGKGKGTQDDPIVVP